MGALKGKSESPNKVSRVTKRQRNSFIQIIQEPLVPLLEHLTELYKHSAEGTAENKKKVIYWLLLQHQNVFPKNENDLGHTHVV